MNKDLKKVLIVEDDELYQSDWAEQLKDKVIIVPAFFIDEAEKKFAANPDIAAITMDGRVPPDNTVDARTMTTSLVREFRKTFTGPIIAASGDQKYRQELIKAGCNFELEAKRHLPQKLLEVLGLL